MMKLFKLRFYLKNIIIVFIFLFALHVTRYTLRDVNAQSSCTFRPVTFILEKRSNGKLYPLKSPNPLNWGVIYDKVKESYGYKPENLSAFNKLGEFDPCGEGACEINGGTFEFIDLPEAKYLIKQGDTADVTFLFDRTAFKIVETCLPYQKCAPTTGKNLNIIKDIPVACAREYRFGWVVERSSINQECSLEDVSCSPQSLRGEFRNNKRLRVGWNNPDSKCREANYSQDQIFIDIYDSQKQRICSKNQTLDSADTSTDCVLGRDKARPNNKEDVKEFTENETYTISVALSNGECQSPQTTTTIVYNGPTATPTPKDEPTATLAPEEPTNIPPTNGPQCGNTCIYSEDREGITKCFEGNCLDGSSNCSLNNNCGFVAGCTSSKEVTCPGHISPPPPPPPPPPSSLPYTIEIRNTAIKPVDNAKELITNPRFRPHAVIKYYDTIFNASIARGWNPALILAIWLEETGGSTTTIKQAGGAGLGLSKEHLGCNPKKVQHIEENLNCIFDGSLRVNLRNDQFEEFARSYCGPRDIPTCSKHPNFLRNLGMIYDKLVPQGTYGARRTLTLDVNQDGTVNTLDYIKVLNKYGQKDVNTFEDVSGDFKVNPIDLSSVLENLGTSEPIQL